MSALHTCPSCGFPHDPDAERRHHDSDIEKAFTTVAPRSSTRTPDLTYPDCPYTLHDITNFVRGQMHACPTDTKVIRLLVDLNFMLDRVSGSAVSATQRSIPDGFDCRAPQACRNPVCTCPVVMKTEDLAEAIRKGVEACTYHTEQLANRGYYGLPPDALIPLTQWLAEYDKKMAASDGKAKP